MRLLLGVGLAVLFEVLFPNGFEPAVLNRAGVGFTRVLPLVGCETCLMFGRKSAIGTQEFLLRRVCHHVRY